MRLTESHTVTKCAGLKLLNTSEGDHLVNWYCCLLWQYTYQNVLI